MPHKSKRFCLLASICSKNICNSASFLFSFFTPKEVFLFPASVTLAHSTSITPTFTWWASYNQIRFWQLVKFIKKCVVSKQAPIVSKVQIYKMIVLVFYIYSDWIDVNIRPPELFSVLMALVYDPLPLSNSAHTIIFLFDTSAS